jgi:hypothetical protein
MAGGQSDSLTVHSIRKKKVVADVLGNENWGGGGVKLAATSENSEFYFHVFFH